MHVGWAALFSPPRGGPAPSFDELRSHIESRLSRAPRYRQKLEEIPWGANDPVWIDDEQFDLTSHVIRTTGSKWGELVDKAMSAPLEHSRPLWELWIADRLPDGRIGVIGKAHHCMVDGLAAVELAALLLDETPKAPDADPETWLAEKPPGRSAAPLRRRGWQTRGGIGDCSPTDTASASSEAGLWPGRRGPPGFSCCRSLRRTSCFKHGLQRAELTTPPSRLGAEATRGPAAHQA